MSGLPPDPTATGGTNLELETTVTAPAPTLPVPAQAVTHDGGQQWLRKWSLVVTGFAGAATAVLELSAGQESALGGPASTSPQGQPLAEGLAMKFHTYALDTATPNHAAITVYNLKDETARRVQNGEFYGVILQAGYATGKYGLIFRGTIKAVKRGRQSPVDSYIIIYASDADIALTQKALDPIYFPRDSTGEQRYRATVDQLGKYGVTAGPFPAFAGQPVNALQRSKVQWGMANNRLDETSKPLAQWSVQNGAIQVVNVKSYLPGEVVILNAKTGLVGFPEAQQGGVFVTALLNPAIKVRGRIKINNAEINDPEPAITTTQGPGGPMPIIGYPSYNTPPQFFAPTAADGTYIVLYVEYEGETRGSPWYVHLVCLLIDESTQTLAPGNELKFVPDPTTFPGHL
jgi:hypothetical protein